MNPGSRATSIRGTSGSRCALVTLSILMAFGSLVVRAATLPECSPQQLAGYSPGYQEVAAHRRFELPLLSYPFDSKPGPVWGMHVAVGVDASGRPVCESHRVDYRGRPQPMNPQRESIVRASGDWRYTPFVKDGRPVEAIVDETVYEQELPKRSMPLPVIASNDVEITLDRGECLGDCPVYTVNVRGDGSVIYDGDHYVAVPLHLAYRVPEAEVAKLFDDVRRADIWSLRPSYEYDITDMPMMKLTVRMGTQVHTIKDYVGWRVGMPTIVEDIMGETDEVARTGPWKAFSADTIARLQAIHFDFASPDGAKVLVGAVRDRRVPDWWVIQLLDLGASMHVDGAGKFPFMESDSALDSALRMRRDTLVDPLIERGALTTLGKPDQAKIDAAFRAAIYGGQLKQVQRIWDAGGPRWRPSLSFDDVSREDTPKHLHLPVTFVLRGTVNAGRPSDTFAIARWLVDKGCDPKAVGHWGTTLLHVAVRSGDLEFVRYLLQRGVDPSSVKPGGDLAIMDAEDEQIALLLLDAGTDFSRTPYGRRPMRELAAGNGWKHVLQWLDAHKR
ncbi:MAG: ankyrin repeat domain-containing protein [Proteobacteria bacterium]|nr:ankyrin repeat domain-containing protein [Pseudomonadota bacterium]MBS0463655.1 ankyrin repeat domain-containing protein [Pseudomonadota bacterium]